MDDVDVSRIIAALFGFSLIGLFCFVIYAWDRRKRAVPVQPPLIKGPYDDIVEASQSLDGYGQDLRMLREGLRCFSKRQGHVSGIGVRPTDPLHPWNGQSLTQLNGPTFELSLALQIKAHQVRERALLVKMLEIQAKIDRLAQDHGIETVDHLARFNVSPIPKVRIELAPREELDKVQAEIGVLREREEALIAKLLLEEQANAQGPHRKAAGIASRDGN